MLAAMMLEEKIGSSPTLTIHTTHLVEPMWPVR
jgi:hypothetical protein